MKSTLSSKLIRSVLCGLPPALFPLGNLVMTTGAWREVGFDEALASVCRHATGDWGELDPHDREENDFSLRSGYRLLSAYRTNSGLKFWIITEADRSTTTILLPEEY